ncbi:MAG TPA: hypothetical protein VFG58_00885 [Solirubrobacterales bacterium]|nr:hypothetical protein [Solirubrobacterales bacterium]
MKRLILSTLVGAALTLLVAAVALAKPEVVRVGNLVLRDNGGISPTRLPRHRQAPVAAILKATIRTADDSHLPAVREVVLDVDRIIHINARGLPVCKARQLEARDTKAARRICGRAIVGRGAGSVEIAFPEQKPIMVSSPLTMFNGGVRGGTTTLFVHAFITVPVPAAIVIPIKITSIHRGRYGLHTISKIPPIAGGSGSVSRFKLKIDRKFAYRGKKASYLTASCPTGHYFTKGHVLFDDGTRLDIVHVLPCTPSR